MYMLVGVRSNTFFAYNDLKMLFFVTRSFNWLLYQTVHKSSISFLVGQAVYGVLISLHALI